MSSTHEQIDIHKFSAPYNIEMIVLGYKPFLTTCNLIKCTIYKEYPHIVSCTLDNTLRKKH